jgi:hypothetical protein
MKLYKTNEIFLICFFLILSNIKSVRFPNKIVEENFLTYELTKKNKESQPFSFVNLRSEDESGLIQNLTRNNAEYSGKVTIGNPPQEFDMVFDTGSANFIITSSRCESCRHKKYDSSLSKTASNIKRLHSKNNNYVVHSTYFRDEIFIRFGTGDINTIMTTDSVCLGGIESQSTLDANKTCVKKLLILEAIRESPSPFNTVQFDGIIGLSFSHLSLEKESNFIDQLLAENKIRSKLFSFYFNNNDENKSQIHIGGIKKSKFKGDIYYADVISKDYWEIKIDSISYGNQKIETCKDKICTAIIDTGTSMLAGPTYFMQQLEKSSYIRPDCSNFNLLENLRIEINGLFFNLDPEFYTYKYKLTPSDEDYECFNAYMNINALSDARKTTILLGIPFLKKYYTIFDRDNMKVGFAVAKHD